MSHIRAAGHGQHLLAAVHIVRPEHLVKKVNVARGQLERLDLAELVRRQRGDDLPQLGEGLVQRLGALALAHVGEHSLVLQVFIGLSRPRNIAPDPADPLGGGALAATPVLLDGWPAVRAARGGGRGARRTPGGV